LLRRVAGLAGEGVCMALVQLGNFGAANITLCPSGSLAGRRLLAGAARVVADVADRALECVVLAVAQSGNRPIQALWSSLPAWKHDIRVAPATVGSGALPAGGCHVEASVAGLVL
jgi:hypothetical protein